MSIRDELLAAGFRQAGAIRVNRSGGCDYFIILDVTGCIVYAHVVGEMVKKFGTTAPSLRARVSQNASTINQVIALQEGRAGDAAWHHRPFDAFKRLAPEIIKAGQTIEVSAVESTDADYKAVERQLNAQYKTIANGWATKLGWQRALTDIRASKAIADPQVPDRSRRRQSLQMTRRAFECRSRFALLARST